MPNLNEVWIGHHRCHICKTIDNFNINSISSRELDPGYISHIPEQFKIFSQKLNETLKQ